VFKLGIVRRAKLGRRRTWFGARKFASVLLLHELASSSDQTGDYDPVLRLLQMANGTWRDSSSGRLAVLDRVLLALVRRRWPTETHLRVLDLGVASGITSVELFRTLQPWFSLEFVATDLWRHAIAVRHTHRRWSIIFDTRGAELQHIIGPFVLPGQGDEPVLYPVNRLLRSWSRRHLVPRARAALVGYDSGVHAEFETIGVGDCEVVKVPLLSAECLALCERSGDFHFETLDVLEPFGRQAEIVRAMNIITPSHFREAELRRALRHCLAALSADGVLVLGRSPTDEAADVGATIYGRQGAALQVLERINGGAEVEGLIEDAWNATRRDHEETPLAAGYGPPAS
jgi:hypothetical protein